MGLRIFELLTLFSINWVSVFLISYQSQFSCHREMCDRYINGFVYFFDKSQLYLQFYFFLNFFECRHSDLHKLT